MNRNTRTIEAKNDLMARIIELELEMFLRVNAREKASCQEHPERFRAFRAANFCAWSQEALASYHSDLIRAKAKGTNLLTLKYARMEGIIPPLTNSPLVDAIVDVEMGWVRELAAQYPCIHSKGRPIDQDSPYATSIRTYLRGELETFSEKTLELYHRNVVYSREQGKNLAKERLLQTVRNAGFSSLDEAEAYLVQRRNPQPATPTNQSGT